MSVPADSPRCDHEGCENPSTMVNGDKRWCDEHPFGAADSPLPGRVCEDCGNPVKTRRWRCPDCLMLICWRCRGHADD